MRSGVFITGAIRALIVILLASSAPALPAPEEPIKPLPATLHQDPERAALGRRLFNDPRLSANDGVSCASCHDVNAGGADGLRRSRGFDGRLTTVNTPTVLNAAFNFRQFWDARAETLEAQIDAVVRNPVEMGSDWQDVVRKVSSDDAYRQAFRRSYRDGITARNIQDAIAAYERTLITPDSRFDRYLRGDTDAITAEEKAGYARFKQLGCVACHQGVNIGGNMVQKLGVMRSYPTQVAAESPAALGRYALTGDPRDLQTFKVPSLRNIALTAPYLHDGSAKTLEEAVAIMLRYQLGRIASHEDIAAIVKFLNALTGELPAAAR